MTFSKVNKVAITSIFSVIIFTSKLFLPTPIDKMFIIIQALLLALSSLILKRMGATYVATISGILITLCRPTLAPFSLIFSIMYGVLIDALFYLFKVKIPQGDVRTNRVILALTLSTAIVGLLTFYVTVMIGLMPMLPILYLTIIISGIINGFIAGYFTSIIWNKYLKYKF
ncbi:MAG: hypothetical protein QXK35_07840 [Nitrososphaerales archaeon]